jgi:hypothetical protein
MDCSEAWLIYSAFTTLGITLLKGISDFCIFINLRFDVPYIFADNTETEEYVKTDIEILNMMYEDDKILIVKNILRNTEMDDFEKRKAYLDFSTKMRNRVLN